MGIMKLRRRSKFPDLRGLPLDGVDMFLLSRLEGELTLTQLVDLVPVCEPQETELRVYQLARLGLIEGPPVKAPVKLAAEPITAPAPAPVHLSMQEENEADTLREDETEELITVRPPAPKQHELEALITRTAAPDQEEMATLPPPPKTALRENPLTAQPVNTDETVRVRTQRRA